MVSIVSLECPVCGAPFAPGAERCPYCGSILVLQMDHPRIDPRTLNRAVINERIAGFRDALARDPGNVAAYYGLGVAYYNLGLTEAAIHELEHACRLTPENPHIHTQLAVAYREEQRSGDREAQEELEDHVQYALRLDPDNVEALLLRAELQLEQGHHADAIGHLRRAYEREPERVRERLRDALLASIRGSEQHGRPTERDRVLLAQVDPESARQLAHSPGSRLAPPAQPPAKAVPAPVASMAGRRVKGALKGLVVGLVSGFVVLMILAAISNAFEEDSTPYNVILVMVIVTFLAPIVLAVRGWYVAGRERAEK